MREPSERLLKCGGWLHPLDADLIPKLIEYVRQRPEPPKIDAFKMFKEFLLKTTIEIRKRLAESLGVRRFALDAIGCAWSDEHQAWVFPMRDAEGNIIGLRLRDENGHKWAVKGSRAGLFMSDDTDHTILLTEGPTDAAAALSIGFVAIGRPSCMGQEAMVVNAIRKKRASRVIIIADNDVPGWRGAQRLSEQMKVPHVLWPTPAKDLRESVKRGVTRQMIESITNSMVWRQPR